MLQTLKQRKFIVKKSIFIFALTLLFSFNGLAQKKVDRETINNIISERGQANVLIKYPGFNALTEIGRHLSVSGVKDGLASIVLAEGDLDYFTSLGVDSYIIEEEGSKSVVSAATVADAMNWDKYPSYQQYDSIMHKFANDYPMICRLDTIGESYQGRQVLVLKISDNVAIDEPEPEVFYTSTMHGDELAGYILMLRLAEHLVTNYTPGTLEERLIDSLEIWINPLANPDGTYRDPDLPGSRDTIYNPIRENHYGTDLNRSFPAPFVNEPPDNETYNFINFQEKRKFVLSMNFHSGYEVVNYPWDTWLSKDHADSHWFEAISRSYADTVHYQTGGGYLTAQDNGIVKGSVWYIIYGGRQDYVTWAQHGREVTVELDETKQTPGVQLPVLWEYNYRSLLRYLENAIYGIHGVVTDSDSGDPLPAKIFITHHDSDSSHIYTDTLTGKFTRLLYPGVYDLLFSAEGYNSKLIEGVTVSDRQQVWLNVKMESIDQSIEAVDLERLKIWPVPAEDKIFVEYPDGYGGLSQLTLFSTTGTLIYTIEKVIDSNNPVDIDISHLSSGLYFCRVRSIKTGRSFTSPFIKR